MASTPKRPIATDVVQGTPDSAAGGPRDPGSPRWQQPPALGILCELGTPELLKRRQQRQPAPADPFLAASAACSKLPAGGSTHPAAAAAPAGNGFVRRRASSSSGTATTAANSSTAQQDAAAVQHATPLKPGTGASKAQRSLASTSCHFTTAAAQRRPKVPPPTAGTATTKAPPPPAAAAAATAALSGAPQQLPARVRPSTCGKHGSIAAPEIAPAAAAPQQTATGRQATTPSAAVSTAAAACGVAAEPDGADGGKQLSSSPAPSPPPAAPSSLHLLQLRKHATAGAASCTSFCAALGPTAAGAGAGRGVGVGAAGSSAAADVPTPDGQQCGQRQPQEQPQEQQAACADTGGVTAAAPAGGQATAVDPPAAGAAAGRGPNTAAKGAGAAEGGRAAGVVGTDLDIHQAATASCTATGAAAAGAPIQDAPAAGFECSSAALTAMLQAKPAAPWLDAVALASLGLNPAALAAAGGRRQQQQLHRQQQWQPQQSQRQQNPQQQQPQQQVALPQRGRPTQLELRAQHCVREAEAAVFAARGTEAAETVGVQQQPDQLDEEMLQPGAASWLNLAAQSSFEGNPGVLATTGRRRQQQNPQQQQQPQQGRPTQLELRAQRCVREAEAAVRAARRGGNRFAAAVPQDQSDTRSGAESDGDGDSDDEQPAVRRRGARAAAAADSGADAATAAAVGGSSRRKLQQTQQQQSQAPRQKQQQQQQQQQALAQHAAEPQMRSSELELSDCSDGAVDVPLAKRMRKRGSRESSESGMNSDADQGPKLRRQLPRSTRSTRSKQSTRVTRRSPSAEGSDRGFSSGSMYSSMCCSGSDGDSDSSEASEGSPARKAAAAAAGGSRKRPRARSTTNTTAAGAAGSAAAAEQPAADATDPPQQQQQPAKRQRKPSGAAARSRGTAAAAGGGGGGGGEAPSAAAVPKPRRKKAPAERDNFRKFCSAKNSFSQGRRFLSKAAAANRGRRPFRAVLVSGKVLRGRAKPPVVAGQGSEYVDGFQVSTRTRCLLCGAAGHWVKDCPLKEGAPPPEEAGAAGAGGGAAGAGAAAAAGGAAGSNRHTAAGAAAGGSGSRGRTAPTPPPAAAGAAAARPAATAAVPLTAASIMAAAGVQATGAVAGGGQGGGLLGAAPGQQLPAAAGGSGQQAAPAARGGSADEDDEEDLVLEEAEEAIVVGAGSSSRLLQQQPPAAAAGTGVQSGAFAPAQLRAMLGVTPGDAPLSPGELGDLSDASLERLLRAVWGHAGFRRQQLPLVRGVLAGRSQLAVLPTGTGKSLVYQLPALLLPGLVVVVSPLLALMRDQVQKLPPGLPGAMLQGAMSRGEVEEVLQRAAAGELKLLYLAPEKLGVAAVLQALLSLSPLPLVCIDEAHCMAEWGHSFRPAYFRLGHLVTQLLQPRCLLAVTATATPPTRRCVCALLGIPPEGVTAVPPLRENLVLHVEHVNGGSKGGEVASRVVTLLMHGALSNVSSVVVYCGYKAGADALAAQLQRQGLSAASYHAGKRLQQREIVQEAFLSGRLRVVVATVAFGMGVDKQDLGAVLHTSLPHSLEEYVQQVGRAGRDGSIARCWAWVDDNEYLRQRALAHSNIAPRGAVLSLLQLLFGDPADPQLQQLLAGPGKAGASRGKQQKGMGAQAGRKRKQKEVVEQEEEGEDSEEPEDGGPGAEKATKPQQQSRAGGSGRSAAAAAAAGCRLAAAGTYRAAALPALQQSLDLSGEVVEAVLSFLQGAGWATALPNTAARLDLRFHGRSPQELGPLVPVVAAILATRPRCYGGTHKVDMGALVGAAGQPPSACISALAELAAAREVSFDLSVDQALAWRVLRTPPDLVQLAADMERRLDQVVRHAVARLDACYEALSGAAMYSSAQHAQHAQQMHLRGALNDYFEQDAQAAQLPAPPTVAAAAAGASGGAGERLAVAAAAGPPAAAAANGSAGSGVGAAAAPAAADTGGAAAAAGAALEAAASGAPLTTTSGTTTTAAAAAGGASAPSAPLLPPSTWEPLDPDSPVQRPPQDTLRRQLRALLASDAERFAAVGRDRLTGLVLARIAAGLGSPAFPAAAWCKGRDWGRWGAVDFRWLLAAAEGEVAAFWQRRQQQGEEED